MIESSHLFFRKTLLGVFVLTLIYALIFNFAGLRFSSSYLLIMTMVLTPAILFLEMVQLKLQSKMLFIISCVLCVLGANLGIKDHLDLDFFYFPISTLSILLFSQQRIKSYVFVVTLPLFAWLIGSLIEAPLVAGSMELSDTMIAWIQRANFGFAFVLTGLCLFKYLNRLNYLQEKTLEELEKSKAIQARLDDAQRLAKIGSWEFDLETKDLFWSQEQYRIFELDRQPPDSLYQMYRNRFHADDISKVDAVIESCIRTGKPYVFEHRIVSNNGKIKYILGRGEAVKDANGKVVRLKGTGQDITEQKRAQEALDLHRLKLYTLSKKAYWGDLATGLVEKLQQQMKNVELALDDLRKEEFIHVENQNLAVQRLESTKSQLQETFQIFKKFRSDDGIQAANLEVKSNLREVASEIEGFFKEYCSHRQIQFFVQAPSIALTPVSAVNLRQILTHFLTNSFEAIESQDFKEVVIRIEEEGTFWKTSILDTGTLLKPEIVEKLMRPFFTTKSNNAGLSLCISKELIEAEGGRITYQVQDNRNSFVMFVPKALS